MESKEIVAKILEGQDVDTQLEAALHQKIQEQLEDRKKEIAQDLVK